MNSIPTYRKGRTVYRPGARDRGGLAGFCSLLGITLFVFILPLVALIFSEHHRYHFSTALLDALQSDIQDISLLNSKGNNGYTSNSSSRGGPSLGHGISSHIDCTTTDPEMDITISGALHLNRNTEYCQWHEMQSESCETCSREIEGEDGSSSIESYECNCEIRYDYVKKWTKYRINSLLFAEPASHHNPRRDPMPSSTFSSQDAHISFESSPYNTEHSQIKAKLHPQMLKKIRKAHTRKVGWVRDGVPPIPPFWKRWIPDRTRYESVSTLPSSYFSQQGYEDEFTYVGNGYFFSPYKANLYESLFKHFMQYMEGTLFDLQFGDLIPSCTTGDVRVHYTIQDPKQISVLGKVSSSSSTSTLLQPNISIEPQQFKNGINIGFVHAGAKSVQQMILAEDSDSFWFATIFRVLFLLVWCTTMSRLLGAYNGRSVAKSHLSTHVSCVISLWSATIGAIWVHYWGIGISMSSSSEPSSVDTLFLILTSVVLLWFVVTQHPPPRSNSLPGWNAVWCMIGRWVGTPPSWRVEKGYTTPASSSSSSADYQYPSKQKKQL